MRGKTGRLPGRDVFSSAFTSLFYTRYFLTGIPGTFMISSGNVIMTK